MIRKKLENGVERLYTAEEDAAASAHEKSERDTYLLKSIKAEASRRITAMAPEWQQRNMLARASELLEIVTFGGTLTPDQETERQNLGKGRAAIQAIRVKSNTLETSITSMTAGEKAAFDPTLDTHWA